MDNALAHNSIDASRISTLQVRTQHNQYPSLFDLNLHYQARRHSSLRSVSVGDTHSELRQRIVTTVRPNSSSSANSNSSNVTRQMGNLTLRSHYDGQYDAPARETIVRESTSEASQSPRETIRRIQPSIRQLYRRCNLRPNFLQELHQIMQQSRSAPQPLLFQSLQHRQSVLSSRPQRPLPVIQQAVTTTAITESNTHALQQQLVPTSSLSQSDERNRSTVRRFFDAISEAFFRGNITPPLIPLFGQFDDFTGTITDTLAMKIAIWLLTDFPRETIVQNVFRKSLLNCTNKVIDLFSQCGIEMQVTNAVTIVNREQPMNLVIILTYILQAVGYNNNYFVTADVT